MTWQQIFVGIMAIMFAIGLNAKLVVLFGTPLLFMYGIHLLTGLLTTDQFAWYLLISGIGLCLLSGYSYFRANIVSELSDIVNKKIPSDVTSKLLESLKKKKDETKNG